MPVTKRILANDGIAADGREKLEAAGFEVVTDTIPQSELPSRIGEFDVLVVRSATKVNREVLQNPGKLKLVVRAGVGIDNIDVKAAEEKGITVRNTPNSSSLSVAELTFAHLFSLVRHLHDANRQMPQSGAAGFKDLKNKYSEGVELRAKTLGIIGFGRIGQETAKIAVGLGMDILVHNRTPRTYTLTFDHLPFQPVPEMKVETLPLEEVLQKSDFVSLHVPGGDENALLGPEQLQKLKKGSILINCARGGVVNEDALIDALQSGQIGYAGIDVFANEPKPRADLLGLPNVSLTPHIGASTAEAQQRVGLETAEVILQEMQGK